MKYTGPLNVLFEGNVAKAQTLTGVARQQMGVMLNMMDGIGVKQFRMRKQYDKANVTIDTYAAVPNIYQATIFFGLVSEVNCEGVEIAEPDTGYYFTQTELDTYYGSLYDMTALPGTGDQYYMYEDSFLPTLMSSDGISITRIVLAMTVTATTSNASYNGLYRWVAPDEETKKCVKVTAWVPWHGKLEKVDGNHRLTHFNGSVTTLPANSYYPEGLIVQQSPSPPPVPRTSSSQLANDNYMDYAHLNYFFNHKSSFAVGGGGTAGYSLIDMRAPGGTDTHPRWVYFDGNNNAWLLRLERTSEVIDDDNLWTLKIILEEQYEYYGIEGKITTTVNREIFNETYSALGWGWGGYNLGYVTNFSEDRVVFSQAGRRVFIPFYGDTYEDLDHRGFDGYHILAAYEIEISGIGSILEATLGDGINAELLRSWGKEGLRPDGEDTGDGFYYTDYGDWVSYNLPQTGAMCLQTYETVPEENVCYSTEQYEYAPGLFDDCCTHSYRKYSWRTYGVNNTNKGSYSSTIGTYKVAGYYDGEDLKWFETREKRTSAAYTTLTGTGDYYVESDTYHSVSGSVPFQTCSQSSIVTEEYINYSTRGEQVTGTHLERTFYRDGNVVGTTRTGYENMLWKQCVNGVTSEGSQYTKAQASGVIGSYDRSVYYIIDDAASTITYVSIYGGPTYTTSYSGTLRKAQYHPGREEWIYADGTDVTAVGWI